MFNFSILKNLSLILIFLLIGCKFFYDLKKLNVSISEKRDFIEVACNNMLPIIFFCAIFQLFKFGYVLGAIYFSLELFVILSKRKEIKNLKDKTDMK